MGSVSTHLRITARVTNLLLRKPVGRRDFITATVVLAALTAAETILPAIGFRWAEQVLGVLVVAGVVWWVVSLNLAIRRMRRRWTTLKFDFRHTEANETGRS